MSDVDDAGAADARPIKPWNTAVPKLLAQFVDVESARRGFRPVGTAPTGSDKSLHDLASIPTTVSKAAEVVYDHLASHRISYDQPGYSPSGDGTQRVFLPNEVATRTTGTCVDLAIAFCALALDAGLRPFLIGTTGHVFAAVQVPNFDLKFPRRAELSTPLRKYIEQASLIPIETTGAASQPEHAAGFADAVTTATDHANSAEIEFVLDIKHLHEVEKLTPPPPSVGEVTVLATDPSPPPWAMAALGVVAVAALTAVFFLWPDGREPLVGLPSQNVVVFPFAGESEDNPVSTEVTKLIGPALGDTWTVKGPEWADTEFPSGDFAADRDLLSDLNVGYGIFGTVDPAKPDELTSVGVWFSPDVVGAELLGIVGPVIWLDSIPNVPASRRTAYAGEQVDDFSQLLASFDILSGAQTDAQLLEARQTLLPLTGMVEPIDPEQAPALQLLARGYVGQISLVRSLFAEDADAGDHISIAKLMFDAVIDDARTELEVVRAQIGLMSANILDHGCSPSAGALADAQDHLRLAGAAATGVTDESGDIALRLAIGAADLAWCEFRAELMASGDAIEVHTAALSMFEARTESEKDRVEFLVADAYLQRALLRAEAGIDGAGCSADFEQAITRSPPLYHDRYRESRDNTPCAA